MLGAGFFARSAAAQTPAPPEKTAGEARKNVQVLKDVPDSDFDNTMWFIAGSLGVPCQHCHTNAFDSDAKQSKLTARSMIKMTRELNAANFGGKQVVTCNTCHQGSTQPNGVPGFWGKANKTPEQIAAYLKERQPGPPPGQTTPPPSSPAPAAPAPLPSVDSILENYRKAVGATSLTSMHMSADLDLDLSPQPVHLEIYASFPDKFAQVITGGMGHFTQIVNGDHGWNVTPAGTTALTPEQLTGLKANFTQLLAPLKFSAPDATRTVTGIEKIGDRSYYVVASHTPKNRRKNYFDTQSGLLYKSRLEVITALGFYPAEASFEDYRDVNGVKLPFSLVNIGISGGGRYKFSAIEANVPLDPKLFEPPPPAPPPTPK
jgi:hypothetical protein